jgi:hypothetical protein
MRQTQCLLMKCIVNGARSGRSHGRIVIASVTAWLSWKLVAICPKNSLFWIVSPLVIDSLDRLWGKKWVRSWKTCGWHNWTWGCTTHYEDKTLDNLETLETSGTQDTEVRQTKECCALFVLPLCLVFLMFPLSLDWMLCFVCLTSTGNIRNTRHRGKTKKAQHSI